MDAMANLQTALCGGPMFERLKRRFGGGRSLEVSTDPNQPEQPLTAEDLAEASGDAGDHDLLDGHSQAEEVIVVDQKRYAVADLSSEIKELVAGVRTADRQIQLRRATVQLLLRGRQQLHTRLKERLTTVEPLGEDPGAEAPSWSAQIGGP